jgi:hypothetical protein
MSVWQHIRARWKWFAVLAILIVLVLPAFVAFGLIPGLAPEKISPATVTYSKMPQGAALSVSLEAPPSRLAADASSPLELVLTNASAAAIRVIQMNSAGCPRVAVGLTLPADIGPHESLRQTGTLSAPCASGQYSLRLSLQWEEPAAKARYAGFVSTSPIAVATRFDEALPRYFSIVAGLLRNFGWPVVLALLGFWWQEHQGNRDHMIKEQQDARDSRGRILGTVLPEYTKLVQEHYLSISRRLLEAEVEAGKYLDQVASTVAAGSPITTQPERLLAAILLTRVQTEKLMLDRGGIHFVSSIAEQLLGEASLAFRNKCYTVMGQDDFGAGIELLDAADTLTAALRKCRAGTVFQSQLLPRFSVWVHTGTAEFQTFLRLLQIVNVVFVFECNRPFYQVGPVGADPGAATNRYNWYVDPPRLEYEADLYDVPTGLRPKIHGLIRQWLESIPAECRQGILPPS